MAEWATVIARNEYACPKCGAGKGIFCKTPKGRTTRTPHGDRVQQLSKSDWDRCKGVALTADQAFKIPAFATIDPQIKVISGRRVI